jgi:hypothetical protein
MNKITSMRSLHENLLVDYRAQNWDRCQQTLENLQGFWGPGMDSFYQELAKRIETLRASTLPSDWDGHLVCSDPASKISTPDLE